MNSEIAPEVGTSYFEGKRNANLLFNLLPGYQSKHGCPPGGCSFPFWSRFFRETLKARIRAKPSSSLGASSEITLFVPSSCYFRAECSCFVWHSFSWPSPSGHTPRGRCEKTPPPVPTFFSGGNSDHYGTYIHAVEPAKNDSACCGRIDTSRPLMITPFIHIFVPLIKPVWREPTIVSWPDKNTIREGAYTQLRIDGFNDVA